MLWEHKLRGKCSHSFRKLSQTFTSCHHAELMITKHGMLSTADGSLHVEGKMCNSVFACQVAIKYYLPIS